jgi:hypothetical protein
VIAVQPELELIWQEFENASTYAYAQREALTKIDRLGEKMKVHFRCTVFSMFVEWLWKVKRDRLMLWNYRIVLLKTRKIQSDNYAMNLKQRLKIFEMMYVQ